MSSTPFRTITIAGATGALGYHIADAFLNDGSYKVKILRRKPENENKNATLLASRGAEIAYVDYSQQSDLVKALKGTDVIVSVVSVQLGTQSGAPLNFDTIQSPLLAAAKEANVKRFIPSEFGLLFSSDHETNAFTEGKTKFRERLEKSGIEYTYIFTGMFQEYLGWLGYDVENKKATFYADRNSKVSSTSLPDIGKYTVDSLKMQESRNASINVAGATLSLNEMLKIFEEASGSKWEVVEDKELQHRFRNNIDPVPSPFDYFKAIIQENGAFNSVDNDKFNINPRPISEIINSLVKQA